MVGNLCLTFSVLICTRKSNGPRWEPWGTPVISPKMRFTEHRSIDSMFTEIRLTELERYPDVSPKTRSQNDHSQNDVSPKEIFTECQI